MTMPVRKEFIMHEIFYKLEKEKQNRIINAGMNIFSLSDYKHASTDDIASTAKVDLSKFKDGIDIEKLTKMISWCSEGIWNEGIKNNSSMSEMYEQSLEVYSFYKSAVYKGEFL